MRKGVPNTDSSQAGKPLHWARALPLEEMLIICMPTDGSTSTTPQLGRLENSAILDHLHLLKLLMILFNPLPLLELTISNLFSTSIVSSWPTTKRMQLSFSLHLSSLVSSSKNLLHFSQRSKAQAPILIEVQIATVRPVLSIKRTKRTLDEMQETCLFHSLHFSMHRHMCHT